MPIVTNKVDDPCQECRGDDRNPKCKQCERLGKPCERSNGRHKFRFGSSAKYDQSFAKDQVWLRQPRKANLQFVDQGPELLNFYAADDLETVVSRSISPIQATPESNIGRRRPQSAVDQSKSNLSQSSNITALLSPISDRTINHEPAPINKKRKADGDLSQSPVSNAHRARSVEREPTRFYAVNEHRQSDEVHRQQTSSLTEHQAELRKVYAEYARLEDDEAAWVPPDELLSPAVWKQYFFWPNEKTTTQCACLMRYYTDNLGPWLDIGDPRQHFTLVVPQRARRCPPLLNAIFTVAARHLACLPQYKTATGVVQYHNNPMPKLDQGFAIRYQNASIAYLRELCKHPEYVEDEDLLAATVILRYDDEFKSSLTNSQDETVFRSMQLFVAAQADQSFLSDIGYTPTDFRRPGAFTQIRQEAEAYLKSYHHATFRIALRQECARALMKQMPIELDFTSWSLLQGFDEADDFVWADRHLYHLACVLQFCFDEDSYSQRSPLRWHELRQFEQQWEDNKPMSFAAIHYRSSNALTGEALPEIWYLAKIHAATIQYFNLSRILLTVYNPTTPRLGPGASLAAKQASTDVRRLVLELCGIATSMPGCEPALMQASMAIALCGEHFSDRKEQTALLEILAQLESQHGFPTKTTIGNLKSAWLW